MVPRLWVIFIETFIGRSDFFNRLSGLFYGCLAFDGLVLEVIKMSQGFVLLGDKTTRGGEVISASSTMIVHGKRVALIGDEVRCPLPGHGVNRIVEGCPDWSEDGRAMVINGCRSECGCQVISSAPDCGMG